MAEQVFYDPDLEWLDHVRPVGLVIAPNLIKELGLVPERQTQADTAAVEELIPKEGPALTDPWAFMTGILGWDARYVAGAPGGPELPDELSIRLPEHETTLSPSWAVGELSRNGQAWQLLARVEEPGVGPDERGALGGWEATPHQQFERLLRETGIFAGVLITNKKAERDGGETWHPELRLVYAPRGETSGWLSFPLRDLAGVAGRHMLGGLKRVLSSYQLFNDADDRRLPALLRRSREAQAAVSTKLAEQVLGALHELLRGLDRAEPELVRELARQRPGELYEGLLAVLMRLVFILYAEDRDLIPSETDARARALYDENYSVRGLFSKLVEDEALYPDTMDERLGAWGRLIALFRLVHKGDAYGWIKGRGGKLFDPDVFPFLEGRRSVADAPRILKVPDGFVLRILEGLMTIENRRGNGQQKRARERLSYRTLDVEQIGSVYETVMGFTVETASGSTIAIKAGKKNNVPVFVNLEELAGKNGAARLKWLKERADRDKFPGRVETAIKAAKSASELALAFASVIDSRGSPNEAPVPAGTPILQPTHERRRTGSHYTPRSLTEPIVRHALEPAFERLGPDAKPEDILDLKVCDPAMGSGAFLVEACRALGTRLKDAWARWPETRPRIPGDEDEELHAKRLVAQRCLYGVDKNPMATDLAKLSLWLATLARDHEFTFVDHALRTGDSLAGLSLAQIAATHWDTAKPPTFAGQVVKALLQRASLTRAVIREHGESASEAELRQLLDSVLVITEGARLIGDGMLGAFFGEEKPRKRIERLVEFQKAVLSHLGKPDWIELAVPFARILETGEHPIRPFHWEIEFPEVFEGDNPGFDAIVGNPPFLRGKSISTEYGDSYRDWLPQIHANTNGNADLAAHFFRRAFALIRNNGLFGLVATNTISQGDTRETGLMTLLMSGGGIAHAVSRLKWPGEASVTVSVVHVQKGAVVQPILDGKPVRRISAYLVDGKLDASPFPLATNARKAFFGTVVLGMGFTFDDDATRKGTTSSLADMRKLIEKAPSNAERIFPFIGGDEVNTDPRHTHRRFVIDFGELTESEARSRWPDLMEIVELRVKPSRLNDKRDSYRRYWWRFAERCEGLYSAISGLPQVLVISSKAAPQYSIAMLPNGRIYSQNLNVFALHTMASFCALQNRMHEMWARFFGATFEDRLAYATSDCFATFPFPLNFEILPQLEACGQSYHEHRAALMISRNEGLTKTYNRFQNPAETASDIVRLRELHAAMDDAMLRAYGWDDLADNACAEYLDETNKDDHKYQGRFFWPAEFRDRVLSRILELNAERAEEERHAGLVPAAGEEERNADLGDEE
jgi:hypothetical protein